VSIPALSGAAQAASNPSVKHITDTLVRMGYFDDLQNGVFLLRDPLSDVMVYRLDGMWARTRKRYNDSTVRRSSLVSTL
jgi:hypothetical protein